MTRMIRASRTTPKALGAAHGSPTQWLKQQWLAKHDSSPTGKRPSGLAGQHAGEVLGQR